MISNGSADDVSIIEIVFRIYIVCFRIALYIWTEGAAVAQYSDWLRTGWPGFNPRQMPRTFFLASASRPALGPTQPPVQWAPEILFSGVKRGRGVMLTTHPHLVPRLRMNKSYTSSPPRASMACGGTALLFFYFTLYLNGYLERISTGCFGSSYIATLFSWKSYPIYDYECL
jgi:hypothetical protein